jgi:WhiB family redox-sensing transcriptional regulator
MREPWRHKAACADIPNADSLFFPERTGRTRESRMAMRVCATCPVQQPCLQWALTHHEDGIWGGTGIADRARIRREQRQRITGGAWTPPKSWS